ncbi:unnamed protein product [Paramecium octaurelia]|uniref:Uncharacterized protein n=1 Tax=Paramecium octaurelia TaxID=43137 RepID=A0A8S1SKG2_PAROT|nr:unnamed protein product [Paramecium octaurelia]
MKAQLNNIQYEKPIKLRRGIFSKHIICFPQDSIIGRVKSCDTSLRIQNYCKILKQSNENWKIRSTQTQNRNNINLILMKIPRNNLKFLKSPKIVRKKETNILNMESSRMGLMYVQSVKAKSKELRICSSTGLYSIRGKQYVGENET